MKNKLYKASNKGFSLIELIVVIAIMAILVGVAVPVYTSYIGKAQKSSDIQLADEIKHALQVKFIADAPESFAGGVVVKLSSSGAEVSGGSEADQTYVKNALKETFGDSWATELKLKYDEWKSGTAQTVIANYTGSSYEGNEEDLLEQVQTLSNLLSGLVNTGTADILGPGFSGFLTENEIDNSRPNAIGNSAVLYVAQTMTGANGTAVSADDVTQKMIAFAQSPDKFDGEGNIRLDAPVVADLIQACGGSTGAAAATMFAVAEGFAQASGLEEDFHAGVGEALAGKNSSGAALSALLQEFLALGNNPEAGVSVGDYLNGGLGRDVSAYISVMGAITESEASILANMDSASCYTDGKLLSKLNAFLTVGSLNVPEGSIAVVLNVNPNGSADIVVYPLDY